MPSKKPTRVERLEEICLRVLLNKDCEVLEKLRSRHTFTISDCKEVVDYYFDHIKNQRKLLRTSDTQFLILRT